MHRAYLGGPINNCTVEGAKGWRDRWALQLRDMGYEPVDPFDPAVALALAEAKADGDLDQAAHDLGLVTPNDIVVGSIALVNTCDVVILNFLDIKKTNTVTIGTCVELAVAALFPPLRHEQSKTIIVVANDVKSSFFSLANYVVGSEAELFSLLNDLTVLREGQFLK